MEVNEYIFFFYKFLVKKVGLFFIYMRLIIWGFGFFLESGLEWFFRVRFVFSGF